MRRSTAKTTKSNVHTLSYKDWNPHTDPLVQPRIILILKVLPYTPHINTNKLKPSIDAALRVHILLVLAKEIQDISLYAVSAQDIVREDRGDSR